MQVFIVRFPLAGTPLHSPVRVQHIVMLLTTLFLSTIWSSTTAWMSEKAEKNAFSSRFFRQISSVPLVRLGERG
jgi:hypothetical protein